MSNTKSNFSIVDRIVAALELGSAGKLMSFFIRLEKTINKSLKALEQNFNTEKLNHSNTLDDYNDKLEDARAELDQVYLDVPESSINTNANQIEFVDTYLYAITKAENKVQNILDNTALAKDNFKDVEKAYKRNVAALEARKKNLFARSKA